LCRADGWAQEGDGGIRQSSGSRFLIREELWGACLQPGKLGRSLPAAGRHVTCLPESLKALVAVADAVDYAYAVVGNE
jgi:hypothetical protein